MVNKIKEVDIDRSDSITENHNKFVLSDYNKSNQKWLCRCCGEYIFYTKIRKHLLDLHNLSIASYYNQYVDSNENPKYILSNARKMRKIGLDKKSKYAGKYKTKWLYCFKLNNECIKVGTTGSKSRLKAISSISDILLFKVLGESSKMMEIEDLILNNTEDYFIYFDKNSEIYKIGGRAEIRDIKCLPYRLKTIKDLGLVYDND